jgi:hypothetical protein
MAWADSRMFEEWQVGMIKKTATTFGGLTTDTLRVALFDNTVTPDRAAAVGSTGYATGTWAGGHVSDTLNSNWAATGQALGSPTCTAATGTVTFDAADTAGAGTLTITNAFGCLIYDDTITAGTVADQGVCFNYFGGGQSVTAGTFTVVWNASGIFTITV